MGWFDSFLEGLWDFFKNQTVFSAILFILAGSLTVILEKRNIVLVYGLWLLVLLRLIVPPGFSLPFSAASIMYRISPRLEIGTIIDMNAGIQNDPGSTGIPVSGIYSAINMNRLLFLFYLTGCVILLFIYIRKILFYIRLKKNALPVNDGDFQLILEKWKKQFKIKRKITIAYTCEFVSPFVSGFFSPVIILPYKIIETGDRQIIETVIAHELAHIKCRDTVWIKIQYFINILYFFNPLVWYVNSRINRIREYICDTMVISKKGIEPPVYARSLLEIIRIYQYHKSRPVPVPVLKHEKRRLKTRIEHIIGGKNMFRKKNLFISMLCLVVIGIIILPMAGNHLLANDDTDNTLSKSGCSISQLSVSGYRLPVRNQDWKGKISLKFGEAVNPFTGETFFHKGIDIPLKTGTPVLASADGTVLTIKNSAEESKCPGKYIIIQHQEGFMTGYYKLDAIACLPDQVIRSGEIIGYSGNTGLSTGPHLHFELRKDGEPVNPLIYINVD